MAEERWTVWLNRYDQPCEERPYGRRQVTVVPESRALRAEEALEALADPERPSNWIPRSVLSELVTELRERAGDQRPNDNPCAMDRAKAFREAADLIESRIKGGTGMAETRVTLWRFKEAISEDHSWSKDHPGPWHVDDDTDGVLADDRVETLSYVPESVCDALRERLEFLEGVTVRGVSGKRMADLEKDRDEWKKAAQDALTVINRESAKVGVLEQKIARVREWAEEELPLNPDTEWFKGYEAAMGELLGLLSSDVGQ